MDKIEYKELNKLGLEIGDEVEFEGGQIALYSHHQDVTEGIHGILVGEIKLKEWDSVPIWFDFKLFCPDFRFAPDDAKPIRFERYYKARIVSRRSKNLEMAKDHGFGVDWEATEEAENERAKQQRMAQAEAYIETIKNHKTKTADSESKPYVDSLEFFRQATGGKCTIPNDDYGTEPEKIHAIMHAIPLEKILQALKTNYPDIPVDAELVTKRGERYGSVSEGFLYLDLKSKEFCENDGIVELLPNGKLKNREDN